jgi:hypothetical protein
MRPVAEISAGSSRRLSGRLLFLQGFPVLAPVRAGKKLETKMATEPPQPDRVDPGAPPERPAPEPGPEPVRPPETEPLQPDFDQPDVSPPEFPTPE